MGTDDLNPSLERIQTERIPIRERNFVDFSLGRNLVRVQNFQHYGGFSVPIPGSLDFNRIRDFAVIADVENCRVRIASYLSQIQPAAVFAFVIFIFAKKSQIKKMNGIQVFRFQIEMLCVTNLY